MHYNSDIYYGHIIKGDLRSAITYIKRFPEQINLHNRFMDVFEHERYITYEVAMAAYRIMKGFSDALGADRIDPAAITVEQIRTVARYLFDNAGGGK